jgi:hypothetical protein
MPPQSNAARKIQAVHRGRLARKDYSMLKRVQQRTAYKQYISSDTLDNDEGLVGWDGLQLLRGFTPSLQHSFRQHGGLKVHISVLAIFKKQFDDKMIRDLRWTTTPIATALTPSALPALMKDLGNMIRDGITELELRGSGWVFEMISVLEMHAARYKPLAGSATVWKLTPALAAKKALVNVKIAIDERHTECFKYAVLSALFPADVNSERSAQYEEHMDDLDWTGMKFPCPVSDIDKFEGNNGIAVNLYGWDEQRKCGYPIRLSKMQTPKQHVDLAVLVDNTRSHYCWIKHFSRFARGATEGHGGAKEYCKHCLTGFSTTKKSTAAQKLERHLSFGCAAITETRPQMPDEDEATLMFKNHDKAIKVPFVIYADFESLTEAIDPTLPDTPHTSYTATFQEHKPCGFCLYVVAADPSVEIPSPFNRPFVFRGEDAVNVFIKTIQQAEKALMPLIKGEKPMIITQEQEQEFQQATVCHEALLVRQEMLSPYAEQLQQKLRIGKDTTKKLVPNLMDKHGYVCDIRALKYYVEHGLIVTKVHAVITFEQSYWMRDYIMFNTKQRTLAKNEFEKDFFKLMSNACFGKTMENLRNRVDMDFVTSNALWGDHATKMPRTLERKLASPLYNGHVVYNEDLAAIKKKKQLLVLNKPIYAGMAILDLSKLHMFEFHYDIILPRYKENAQLLFTDTDSLCYLIKTDDFYKDMLASKDLYDMSNFPRDSPFYDASNKKVLGKFKDECDGAAPSEFVGLRPKMYSLKVGEKEKKTGKGIKRSYVKKHITHDDYVRCISSEAVLDQQQHAVFNVIRNKQHSKKITEGVAEYASHER